MRRLHVPDLPASGDVRVAGDEAHHLLKVLRARVGENYGLFDGRGREVAAQVVDLGRREALLRIVDEIVPRRPCRDVLLCTALPRGRRMEWLVEKCTEAGVGGVQPLVTARGARERVSANDLRRWQRAAVEAAKQCGRADVPRVASPVALPEALTACAARTAFVLDPGAGGALHDRLPSGGAVALLIGPEGGFDDAESALARERGAVPVALGPLILRVETAAVVAVHAAARA